MRSPRPDSRMARIPPQTMHESEMLNTGQCGSWIQSTTYPRSGPGARSSRSVRLPVAPPSSRPSVTAQPALWIRREARRMNTITPTAIAVNTTVIEVPMLNAAPGFRSTRSVSSPPSSRTGGRSDSVATTTALEMMSAASTPTATVSSSPIRRGRRRTARPATAPVSAVPRAACRSRTGSPGGTPGAGPCRSAHHTIRRCRRFPPRSSPAPARSAPAARGRCA